jgi:DNA-binding CsgD family transcriptional regulator
MSRSHAESRKRALARIQRLCCLGVGSEMIMPDLMREVTGLCATQHGVFCWTGPNGATSDYYATFATASELEFYFKEFHSRKREPDLFKQMSPGRGWPVPKPVLSWTELLAVDWSKWLRSDYYNLLWRPYGFYESLGLGLPGPGRVQGMLFVFREADQASFGPRDVGLLSNIAGFVAHSLTQVPLEEGAYTESEDRALFVVDREGNLQHASLHAQLLLSRALISRLSPATKWHILRKPSSVVVGLCRTLAATAGGQIGQSPPVSRLRSPWGEIVLRAYWLGPTDGIEQTRHIGITIERRVPPLLALHRRLENLPLTAREKQVCLLLARDLSGRQLAEVMGVAPSTAITHQRNLYAKLGVTSRIGLLSALQSA